MELTYSYNSYGLCVNKGKNEVVKSGLKRALCYALKTPVITKEDDLLNVIKTYAAPYIKPGDILFISEKMVACTQGRAIPLSDIKPGFFANHLSRFVTKTPAGIGLGMPETMQCAIDECGLFKVLLASAIGVIGKVIGKKGWFYKVLGSKAAGIDGPCHWTIPPYDSHVVLAPKEPGLVASEISNAINCNTVLIVDLNDLGGAILGSSNSDIDKAQFLALLSQNPLGQSDESTPLGVLRPL